MATAHTKIQDTTKVTAYEFETTSAASAAAGWFDMRDYKALLAMYTRMVGTGALSSYRVDASAASNGANPVTVKTGTATTVDAVNDKVILEVSDQEVAAAVSGGRYVSFVAVHDAAATKASVTYVARPKVAYAALTADAIA